jgi:hypothetical protein
MGTINPVADPALRPTLDSLTIHVLEIDGEVCNTEQNNLSIAPHQNSRLFSKKSMST